MILFTSEQLSYAKFDPTKIIIIFPEVAQNSLRIPWVFQVQRIPRVFQATVAATQLRWGTDRRTWPIYILRRLRLTRNAIAIHAEWPLHNCVSSSTKLPAVTQASLNRHSPNKRHLPVARWTEVGSRGQFLSSGWPTIRQPGFDLPRCYRALTNHFRTDQGHCACKGVLLIVIRCNEVTNFLIPSAGNYFVTVMRDVTITDDIWMRTRNF